MAKLTVDYFKLSEMQGGVQSFLEDFKHVYPDFKSISYSQSMYPLYGRIVKPEGPEASIPEFDRSLMINEYLEKYEKIFRPDIIVKNSIVGTFKKHITPMICILQDNNVLGPEILYRKGYYNLMNYNHMKTFLILQESTIKNADAVVASSLHLKECYEKFGKDIKIIENGVDTNLFKKLPNSDELKDKYGIPKDRKIGITVTGFHPIKGWHIQAKLCNDFPDVFWVAVFKSQTEKPRLKNVKIFNQVPREQMPELYGMADFFVLPSAMEGDNVACKEAMSCNLPVIVSNAGGFWNESTKDHEVRDFGIVVNKWKYELYKKALEEMLSGNHKFMPRKYVEGNGFDFETWTEKWRSLIQKLIKEGK